MSDIWTH